MACASRSRGPERGTAPTLTQGRAGHTQHLHGVQGQWPLLGLLLPARGLHLGTGRGQGRGAGTWAGARGAAEGLTLVCPLGFFSALYSGPTTRMNVCSGPREEIRENSRDVFSGEKLWQRGVRNRGCTWGPSSSQHPCPQGRWGPWGAGPSQCPRALLHLLICQEKREVRTLSVKSNF